MSNNLVISAYGSHNAAISMFYKGEYTVVEVERWTNIKNSGLVYYNPVSNPQSVFDEITDWLLSKTAGEKVDTYITGYCDNVIPKFEYRNKVTCDHHTAHAATAFYQSPYDEMLVFTFDGGGDGAFFNVYLADRHNGIKLVQGYKQDLGFPYMVLGEILQDIKRDDLSTGNLVYAGKIMGLCAYGNVIPEWVPAFDRFYSKFHYDGASYIGGAEVMKEAMTTLMQEIGVSDYQYGISRYDGQFAWDIAATSQRAFENQFYKIARKYLEQYPNLPIGLSGGCALNVLLNTRLAYERKGKVFVPPNTNDCGISVGGLLWHLAPAEQVDLTYSGLPVLDKDMFSYYVNKHGLSMVADVSVQELAGYIAEGNIVGVIQGNSEHGSRALGNRSIICSPTGNMKDIINFKVKNREWYRPFAPMVRLQDVSKYFEFEYESRHMTYAAPVKPEWRDKVPAITHQDGTGRLQTVTATQNELIYELLTEFDTIAGIGVLLNTSYNVNGKPILSTLSDAIDLLLKTKLDAVYYNGKLAFKPGESRDFMNIRKSRGRSVKPFKSGKDTVALVVTMGAENNITDIAEKLVKLKDSVDTIILAGSPAACSHALERCPWLKTYEIPKHKWYHYDRLGLYMPESDMPDRLKLMWAREVCEVYSNKFNNFTIVDAVGMDCDTILHETAQLRADKSQLRYKCGQDGYGTICADKSQMFKLLNSIESNLISALSTLKTPPNNRDNLKICVEGI